MGTSGQVQEYALEQPTYEEWVVLIEKAEKDGDWLEVMRLVDLGMRFMEGKAIFGILRHYLRVADGWKVTANPRRVNAARAAMVRVIYQIKNNPTIWCLDSALFLTLVRFLSRESAENLPSADADCLYGGENDFRSFLRFFFLVSSI
jgi:hypothetical protein